MATFFFSRYLEFGKLLLTPKPNDSMKLRRFARSLGALTLLLACPVLAQKNVLQPGDTIIASSSSSPGSEGVANAIDGKSNKYLNFDLATDTGLKPSGFAVTPSIGVTRVTGMRIESANDAPERDPKTVTLEGSNDPALTTFDAGNWESITTVNVPAFAAREVWQSFSFTNLKPYKHYRWTVIDTQTPNDCCMQVAEVELLGGPLPPDVTQPGDPIIASSSSSPGSEGVANAIDNKSNKYLNFDLATDTGLKPSGFVVSPSIGRTVLSGMTIMSANDAPERDPKTVTLEGSNDATVTSFSEGNWEMIQTFDVPAFAAREVVQTFLFDNFKPYRHYRWTVIDTQTPNDCCMQVGEVELLGRGAPKDVTQPGDMITASSSSSPGSEGVANAIDNKSNKYLNFDLATDSGLKPVGFVVTPSLGDTIVTGMTIMSANDAPERDPKTVTLEGSNDATTPTFDTGTWELITTLDVPAFSAREVVQEFFFANSKSYKHYRWTVTETATPNDCCMQVGEVELLAIQEGADCSKARFLTQPENQPVLLGSQATFSASVNGPWPLQWTKNGVAIPGATGTSYTTEAVTADSATNVYAVTIVGCETSQSVQAQIFTPSATKSIGVSFTGGDGRNGTPSKVLNDDITGVHLQAHWNNAVLDPNGTEIPTPTSGSLPDLSVDPIVPLLDSDGNASDITFDWATSGNWGAGTGEETAEQRLLNGLIGGNAPGEITTLNFSNVPAGTHSLIIYSVSPPLQVQVISYTVGTNKYFMRAMNSDEYNPAPGFYRGLSTTEAEATVGDYVQFDGIVAAAGDTISVDIETLTGGFDQVTGVNAVQLVLNTGAAGQPPVITVEPQPVVAEAGKTARLSVTATGPDLTYQWRKGGRNISNGGNISGATTSELTISEFSAADVGVYSVAVFNASGSVISKNATANLSTYDINESLIGYWNLDATGSSTAVVKDATGADTTGTFVPGQVGNAINLDGQTYLFVTNYPKATKAISGSAWIKLDPSAAGDIAIFRNAQGDMIVSGGAARIVGQFELMLSYDGNTDEFHPMATVGIGPNLARTTGSAAVTRDAWHHIAFSADGAQIRLYLDGQQVGSTDYLADINPPQIDYISMGAQLNVDQSDPPILGPDPNNPKWLIGQLDEVALWTRALTTQEVSLVYQAGVAHNAVTTVVVPKPASNPTLTTTLVGNTITINFDSGKLQFTTSLAPGASWTDVANPTQSPYSEQMTGTLKFFRAIVP